MLDYLEKQVAIIHPFFGFSSLNMCSLKETAKQFANHLVWGLKISPLNANLGGGFKSKIWIYNTFFY